MGNNYLSNKITKQNFQSFILFVNHSTKIKNLKIYLKKHFKGFFAFCNNKLMKLTVRRLIPKFFNSPQLSIVSYFPKCIIWFWWIDWLTLYLFPAAVTWNIEPLPRSMMTVTASGNVYTSN